MSKTRRHNKMKILDPMVADKYLACQKLGADMLRVANALRAMQYLMKEDLDYMEGSHSESELASSTEYHRACRVLGLLDETVEVFKMNIKL